ncbi:unnamed protein product [Paramecium octaurelia]|uniref:Uncharacterized protein n=1 Tax=Paramecium octaurelia TaxID=43137 RepID=A0A8S1WPP7_PAROT|nr:unnamed protein product [Paramecium octaurelia]
MQNLQKIIQCVQIPFLNMGKTIQHIIQKFLISTNKICFSLHFFSFIKQAFIQFQFAFFFQAQEECDDGNYQIGDDCLKCEIEQNQVCNSVIKILIANIYCKSSSLNTQLPQYDSKQIVHKHKIKRIGKVNTTKLPQNTISFKLINIDNQNCRSSFQIKQDVGSNLTFGENVLEMEVLDFRPTSQGQLNKSVTAVLEDSTKNIQHQVSKIFK